MPTGDPRPGIGDALRAVAAELSPQARETVLYENFGKHTREVGFLLESGGPDPSVCDLGGGVGINLMALRRLGITGRLALVDQLDEYSEDNRMGAWSRIEALLDAADIEVHRLDIWRDPALPFDDGAFTAVTCLDVVEHLPGHPLRQLRELHRVLRPGGACLISGPNAASLSKRARLLAGRHPYSPFDAWVEDPYYEHYREYVRPEYEALLRLAGFRDVDSEASLAVTLSRARNRYHRRRRSLASPYPLALWAMAAAEAAMPSLRHTVYAWGAK